MASCDQLYDKIGELFEEFVIPHNVFPVFQRHNILTKQDIGTVERITDRKGPSQGARLLLGKLVKDEDWFAKLHTVLCDDSVKLGHIAEIMVHEKNRIQKESASQRSRRRTRSDNSGPVSSLSALYIKYNRDLEHKIRQLFVEMISDPVLVLHVFQMYSNAKVLTKIDCENVQAKMNNNGPYQGADLLFSRLVLYDSWLDVLLQTLKDDDIRLQELAEEIESSTRTIKEDYERERSQILHRYDTNNNVQLADNRMATDDPCSAPRMDGSRDNLLRDNFHHEHESDCAEMRPAARQARSSENKENTVSDGSGGGQNLASQEGSSEKGDGTTGKTQLMSAAKSGDLNLIRQLLNRGANIDECDSEGITALMYAVLKCQFECLQLLVSNGCDVNKRDNYGCTALMIAANEGFTDCLRCLIDANSNVDNANDAGSTALMVAARKGFVGCMQLLIENRCDIEKCHKDGRTALLFAALNGHPKCVDLLIRHRCDVNKANNIGVTALIYAVQSGQAKCAKLLINGGANVDLADKDGNNAVIFAVLCKQTKCLKLLIDSQADINVANNHGYTPLTCAEMMEHRRYVKILREANGGR